MTWDQMAACIALEKQGFVSVRMPHGPDSPTPGPILLAKADNRQLLLVQGDGSTIDLLALHRAADNLINDWGKGSTLPKFVGDWRRLILLANVLNGITEEPK